jgi:ribonuclease P protein component
MKDFSFPKTARLLKRAEFLRVQNNGRRVHGSTLMLFIRPARVASARPRLGITVSTKIHKRSHIRNRIKRSLREAFRHHQHHLKRGVELVVSARPECVSLPPHQLRDDFITILSHAGLMVRGDSGVESRGSGRFGHEGGRARGDKEVGLRMRPRSWPPART